MRSFVIFLLLPYAARQQTRSRCSLSVEHQNAVQDWHNNLRQLVATAELDKSQFGDLQGTDSMFKMTYDCTNDALANALILEDTCKHSGLDMTVLGRSANFKTYRSKSEPKGADLAEYLNFAMEDWRDSVTKPLSKDAIYKNEEIAPFARMIFYKSVNVGCASTYCSKSSKLAIACVYGNV
ncbi:hypothetical protein ANCCAN_06582 [Ancylostoma caninum]|uniref:SCP domain-containing protein n=1 Tax=Ancylostoma caninum TaxID=29170 RepID=A0A368GSJ3_ANCCA|nr:hypothetical protein ANCCAN_06582 [Ancylostoma caninum]